MVGLLDGTVSADNHIPGPIGFAQLLNCSYRTNEEFMVRIRWGADLSVSLGFASLERLVVLRAYGVLTAYQADLMHGIWYNQLLHKLLGCTVGGV